MLAHSIVNSLVFLRPAAKASKGKCLYYTGDDYEEKLQAAKLDVEQQKVPMCTAACLYKVRPN
jgi:hypothetical protein